MNFLIIKQKPSPLLHFDVRHTFENHAQGTNKQSIHRNQTGKSRLEVY